MKFSIKKLVISSLLTVSVLASSLIAAIPAMAANSSITVESKTVANGATFDVNIAINTSEQIAGAQASLTFDPAKLQVNSATYNPAKPFGPDQFNVSVNIANGKINNTLGQINGLTSTTGGATTVTGNLGTWVTLNVTALTADTTAVITLTTTGNSYVANSVPAPLPTDLVNGNLTLGTPPQADLTVNSLVATLVAGTGTDPVTDPAQYTVAVAVRNQGNLAAGATSAALVIDGGTPIILSIPAINAGVTAPVVESAAIILSGSSDSITITVDSTNAIIESNESNNTASTGFSFVYAVGQGTDVYGGIIGTLSFTQPAEVNMGNMVIGPNSQSSTLNVKSNQSWTVTTLGQAPTVSGDANANVNAGKMTKLTGSVYNAYIKLHRQLHVITSGGWLTPYQVGDSTFITPTNADVTLTGTAQTLAFGIAEGQITSPDGLSTLGEDRVLTFSQTLQANDPSLATGSIWDIPVAFVASATGF